MTETVESNADNSFSSENLDKQKSETYFTQEQLNSIVKKVKEDERRLAATQPEHFMEKYGLKNHYASHAGQTPNDLETLKKQVADDIKRSLLKEQEEFANKQLYQALDSQIGEVASKLNLEKDNYSDYDSIIGVQVNNLRNYPHVSVMANSVDNTSDVMYELFKDGIMLDSLERLGQSNFSLLQRKIKDISDAIKEAKQIESIKQPRPPLSQMRPSNKSSASGFTNSISDMAKRYR